MTRLSRRGLVAGSLAAGGLLLLPELRPKNAYAAPTVAPLRLLVLNTPFQVPEQYFHPWTSSSNSTMAPAGSSFYLSFANSVLAPLAPFQSELLIIRGLQQGTYVSAGWTSHASHATALTGSTVTNPQGGGDTTGTSIDNYLYKRMARAGSLSPIYAGFLAGGYENNLCYLSGTGQTPITNPSDLYNTLFANFHAPGNGLTDSQKRQIARRVQALGFSQKYIMNAQTQLPSTSRSYSSLQSHLASVQGLSSQISGTVPTVTCVPPTAGSITNDPGLPQGTNGPPLDPTLASPDMASFIALITEAFACDITRFATLDLGDCDDMMQFINAMPGLQGLTVDPNVGYHFAVTHDQSSDPTDPNYLTMARFKLYYMNQVAAMLSALKKIQDPFNTSQTLYDNTVVLITGEGSVQTPGADPHDSDGSTDQMFVIAGGCGGYFKLGRLFLANGSTKPSVNHNALLTNIVNTFEKNQQDFNPAYVPDFINGYGDYSFSVSPTSWLA